MKIKVFTFLALLGFFTSCQSEYDRQMSKAIKQKEILDKNQQELSMLLLHVEQIEEIKEEINLCAELSGNKSLFLEELKVGSLN